jgi:catechol 2,3-dioxygenase-like lactoylglutathione lyase family enzyme
MRKGLSHIGLATLDMDKTRGFYEHVLDFPAVRCDTYKISEGGELRHIFFDTGRGQLISFIESRGVAGIPANYDVGITGALGVPGMFYHFAFEAGSEAELETRRQTLQGKGVPVTEIVDHEWCKSFYFDDPNGIKLEYCCYTRPLNEDDARMQVRLELPGQALGFADT